MMLWTCGAMRMCFTDLWRQDAYLTMAWAAALKYVAVAPFPMSCFQQWWKWWRLKQIIHGRVRTTLRARGLPRALLHLPHTTQPRLGCFYPVLLPSFLHSGSDKRCCLMTVQLVPTLSLFSLIQEFSLKKNKTKTKNPLHVSSHFGIWLGLSGV